MKFKIVVTTQLDAGRLQKLQEFCQVAFLLPTTKPEQRESMLAQAEGIIAGTGQIDAAMLDLSPNLRVVSRVGVGLDSVDLREARERGVVVTYTPDAPSLAVAELTIGLILNVARHIREADALFGSEWKKLQGVLLADKVVGIAGVGRIGSRVANLLRPFGCTLLGHDIAPNQTIADMTGLEYVSKDNLLRRSDFLTLHLSLDETTCHWLDQDGFRLMKQQAYLINTSRGPVVCESDLVDALKTRRIAGAALDVFETEPYPTDGPLTLLDNVVLTCHMGAATEESRRWMEKGAISDCLRVLRGGEPKHLAPMP